MYGSIIGLLGCKRTTFQDIANLLKSPERVQTPKRGCAAFVKRFLFNLVCTTLFISVTGACIVISGDDYNVTVVLTLLVILIAVPVFVCNRGSSRR